MPYRSDVMYGYDGTFEGLLCCVFESYDKKEIPCAIVAQDAPQMLLYPTKQISTDPQKAKRVGDSIAPKMSQEAYRLVQLGFLTCAPEKELLLLKFLRLGYRYGPKVMDMLTDDTVNALQKAVKHLTNESHLMMGFVRFSIYGTALIAVIEPKNFVLPLLAPHFCTRYANDTFMIYDKTYGMALVYQPYRYEIMPVDHLILPPADQTEKRYRDLWKLFYNTIAIEGRKNPTCRMSHMPKRYWDYLTEFDARSYFTRIEQDESLPVPLPDTVPRTAGHTESLPPGSR